MTIEKNLQPRGRVTPGRRGEGEEIVGGGEQEREEEQEEEEEEEEKMVKIGK